MSRDEPNLAYLPNKKSYINECGTTGMNAQFGKPLRDKKSHLI